MSKIGYCDKCNTKNVFHIADNGEESITMKIDPDDPDFIDIITMGNNNQCISSVIIHTVDLKDFYDQVGKALSYIELDLKEKASKPGI